MRTLYPEGHDVFASGLSFAEDAREWEDRQRMLALVGSEYGVVSGLDVTDVSIAGNPRIQVSAGLAIDAQGYRVVLDSATTVSGLTGADIGSQVTIQRSNVDIFPTAHPITGAAAYTRETDGASVVVSGSCASGLGCVILACIDNVVTGGSASVAFSTTSNTCRKILRISADRLGVGMDVTEHRLSTHTNGISGGTGSLIPSIVDDTTDYIDITPMQTNNWVSINGVLLGTDEINPGGAINIAFIGGGGGDASGSWNLYINSSGQVGKTQSALTIGQFLLGTVDFDNTSGDLTNLIDERVFYEITQDLVRVDLNEAQTNDSLSESSTLKNNLNRLRYRMNALETTAGGAYPVIGNVNCDYNGNTDAVFTTAIGDLPASGGTLVLADGTWVFGNPVVIDKPVRFVSERGATISFVDGVTNAFLVQSDGVEFDGIVFDINYASGGTIHTIDVADYNKFAAKNCIFSPEVLGGGSLYGEFVRIAGGSDFVVEGNRYETDTAQMYLVRVVQSGSNYASGLRIENNILYGLGNANLFHLDSGYAKCVSISHNTGMVGEAGGLRQWMLSDVGTVMYKTSIMGNTYECPNVVGASVPICIQLNHTGGGVIVGNSIGFASPATTYAIGIIAPTDFAINGNQIRNANVGIGINYRCAVNGNTLWDITAKGVDVAEDNNSICGNVIEGSGSGNIGIHVQGANNIVDGNSILSFASGIQDDGGGNFLKITDNTSNKVV